MQIQHTTTIPKTVVRFALRHRIPLYRDANGYYIRDPKTLRVVEATRTAHPQVCHALAMCRRYLARGSQR